MQRRLLGIAAFVLAAAPATAADYHVAPGGSDANSGLSSMSAWATLQHAADTVTAGDTVHVADGSYAGFDLRSSGSVGQPITFVADGTGAQITSDNGVTPDGINVEDAAWVVLDGFVVNGRSRAGIRAAVSQHVTIRRCRCGNNGRWGIFTGFADDLVVEDNETYGSVLEHGIYVSNSGDRPVIRGNHSHDNHANGIHMNGDESQGGDGLISNALVENNVIHGNGSGGGSGINMDGVTDSVVRNNLLYDNHASGISMYRIDGAAGSSGNLVVNNTIVNAADGRWCININGGSTGNTLRNNILYNLHPFRGVITIDASSRSGFSSDYNSLMDRFSDDGDDSTIDFTAWKADGYDTHSFLAAPADNFLVPGSDFHLRGDAPSVDSGSATNAPPFDLDGGARPVGAGFDIGAYENQLPDCGDGSIDAGEVCGEPGLPGCSDPCTICSGCLCVSPDPVCGDALVCGSEQCESNADCSSDTVCDACSCVTAPLCTSGVLLERARLDATASPLRLKLRTEALLPKPWAGIDPAANGLRVLLDSPNGGASVDILLPGGASWKTNASATSWVYSDKSGAVGGITKAVLKDRSKVDDGRLRLTMKGRSASTISLPDVASLRTAVVFGDAGECAMLAWNGPDSASPACNGNASMIDCR